jgi:hypothetical protein
MNNVVWLLSHEKNDGLGRVLLASIFGSSGLCDMFNLLLVGVNAPAAVDKPGTGYPT